MPAIFRPWRWLGMAAVLALTLLSACDLGSNPTATPTSPPVPTPTALGQENGQPSPPGPTDTALPPAPTTVAPTVAVERTPTSAAPGTPITVPPSATPPSLNTVTALPSATTQAGAPTVRPSATTRAGAPTVTPGTISADPAQRTEDLLVHTLIPGRDLYDLTRRLRLQQTAPLTLTMRTTPLNRKVGDQDVFNLQDIQNKSTYSVTATVRIVTAHAYWYVATGLDPPIDLSALRKSSQVWENKIYPTDRKYFGDERSPGIDDDVHITILLADIPGVGGYFSSSDGYNQTVNPYSNEREMIYIASSSAPDLSSGPGNYFEATLAHEFQHMIHNNVSPDRDAWVDEGCSEVAMALNGYDTGGGEEAAMTSPDTQLDAWADTPQIEHYGVSYLFIRYLMQRFGGPTFLHALLASPGAGIAAFEDALGKLGAKQSFQSVFTDWIAANYIDDPKVGDGRYAYDALKTRSGSRLHIDSDSVTHVTRYPFTVSSDVHQYAADYVSLERGPGDTVVRFQGAPTVKVLDTDAHSGQSFWYSNRRDSANMTLTHDFDLSSVPHATLDYWTWFSIEGDFDYGYVEVSTDGGKTWDTLKTRYTTDANPNGANYGHGYTAHSGRDTQSDDPPAWVHEQVDLSAYAGHHIQVRFDYVTDESYNDPGWAIDDIGIPELGYRTDAETGDDGWQAAGFVRIANTLPQRWYVAALEYKGSAVTIVPLPVDATGQGQIVISGLGRAITKAVLVVSGLAPTTTELGTYTITAAKK